MALCGSIFLTVALAVDRYKVSRITTKINLSPLYLIKRKTYLARYKQRIMQFVIISPFHAYLQASTNPITYWNTNIGVNPWRRALVSYFLPIVTFSVIFNIPKFFEVHLVPTEVWSSKNLTNVTEEVCK